MSIVIHKRTGKGDCRRSWIRDSIRFDRSIPIAVCSKDCLAINYPWGVDSILCDKQDRIGNIAEGNNFDRIGLDIHRHKILHSTSSEWEHLDRDTCRVGNIYCLGNDVKTKDL